MHMWEDNIKIHRKGNKMWKCEMDLNRSGQDPVADFCEHDNEP